MNKYVIAILSFFDHENCLVIEEATSEIDAMRKLAEKNDIKISQDMEIEDIMGEFFDYDLSVSFPLKINN